MEQTSVKFESQFCHFHSRKCIWLYRLSNKRPFCPGGDELTSGYNDVILHRETRTKMSDILHAIICLIYIESLFCRNSNITILDSILRHFIWYFSKCCLLLFDFHWKLYLIIIIWKCSSLIMAGCGTVMVQLINEYMHRQALMSLYRSVIIKRKYNYSNAFRFISC